MKTKRKKTDKTLVSDQEVLINEAYLTDTIQAQSAKVIFWHSFVYILFKNI